MTETSTKSVDQALADLKKMLSKTIGEKYLRLIMSLPFTEMVCLEGSDLNEVWTENGNVADYLESVMLKKVITKLV